MRRRSPHPRVGAAASIAATVLLVLWYHLRVHPVASGDAATLTRAVPVSAGGKGKAGAPVQPSTSALLYANGTEVPLNDPMRWVVGPITWFTVLNGPRYFWCDLLASAWHNGITVNIWAWGNKDFNDWLMTWMKLPLSRQFAEQMPPDHLVGFVDGADSLFQLTSPEMADTFARITAETGRQMVMSTEINCAVQSLPDHGCGNPVFPMTRHGRRHLNSGLWLGPAGFVRTFYKHVEERYLPLYRQGSVQRNDQSLVGKAYHDGWRANVTLDAENRLFQSVRKAEGHYCQPGEDSSRPPVPDPDRKRLKNCLTGQVPGVFHFNGYAKPFLGKWIHKFWWHGRRIHPRAAVFVNHNPVALRTLCPKLPYDAPD
eukprot:TRINITY_DN40416_c0_g1_i1.p2 TRINITY_DN40416_c0_g1~~TRINITY_DN40416_c0_g1_i1.p2  ORF type:complete len:371 (+),score=102.54 TRINITY_DN40416_c0_g1_i1:59-1171(+)